MFEVLVCDQAAQDIDQIHAWWAENRSEEQADRWYLGFLSALLTLEKVPERHALASESTAFGGKVRQLNFGLSGKPTHRALDTIRDDRVVVLRVRHQGMRDLTDESS